jgi:hypothetical protein
MTKIKALRQFSHFHLGTVDEGEVKNVADDIAEALIGMELAVEVDADEAPADPPKKETKKK